MIPGSMLTIRPAHRSTDRRSTMAAEPHPRTAGTPRRLLIGRRWRESSQGRRLDVVDPGNGGAIASVADASKPVSDTASTTRMYPIGAAADEFPPTFAEFAAARARGIVRVRANAADASNDINSDHGPNGAMTIHSGLTPSLGPPDEC